jgi:hypothetical protein
MRLKYFMLALAGLLACWAAAPLGRAAVRTVSAQTVATAAMPGGASLQYYIGEPEGGAAAATSIAVGIQGYDRDANKTFDAVAAAVAGQSGVVVVAPLFQVTPEEADRCHHKGVPDAAAGNALWLCGSWSTGKPATNAALTSFQAMDALLAALHTQYPRATRITMAGFSAGGQFVQHYIGFAHPPAGMVMRYIVADPSEFVYFDAFRPNAVDRGTCPKWNNWRYGLNDLPAYLGRGGAAARAAYVAADVTYLEAANDTGMTEAAVYNLLDKNCAAEAEGTYRLDRGQNYAAYDAKMLAMGRHKLIVVPDCAHNVSCVFPKAGAAFTP